MHNSAFAALALDWAYVALDVPPERLEEAVRGLAAAGFAGANVTAPHKLDAAALVETNIRSVNTIVFDGAAAHPADVDYLFFVRKPDKVHHFFTADEDEFYAKSCEYGFSC